MNTTVNIKIFISQCSHHTDVMLGWALHKNAQTAHIWLTTPIWWRGITWSQIWKFLILLIACSMCILRLAISWVLTTSSAGIWLDPPRKGGRFRKTPKGSKSEMVNPLSANTESLSWKGKSNRPLLLTISLSEILPVYNWLANVMAPVGKILTKPLSVVWFL